MFVEDIIWWITLYIHGHTCLLTISIRWSWIARRMGVREPINQNWWCEWNQLNFGPESCHKRPFGFLFKQRIMVNATSTISSTRNNGFRLCHLQKTDPRSSNSTSSQVQKNPTSQKYGASYSSPPAPHPQPPHPQPHQPQPPSPSPPSPAVQGSRWAPPRWSSAPPRDLRGDPRCPPAASRRVWRGWASLREVGSKWLVVVDTYYMKYIDNYIDWYIYI